MNLKFKLKLSAGTKKQKQLQKRDHLVVSESIFKPYNQENIE